VRIFGLIFALFAAIRFGRTLVFLFLKPGGWALLVGAALLYLSATKG
jgi:hypothetical protein